MALPMLVGGSECGPSNPLQNLSKRFEQDRGVQQDFFGTGRAGSSREGFRSQGPREASIDQDAARFFSSSNGPTGGQLTTDARFDVSSLRQALPLSHTPVQVHAPPIQQQSDPSAWAMDFMQHTPLGNLGVLAQNTNQLAQPQTHATPTHSPSVGLQYSAPVWNPGINAFRMNNIPAFLKGQPRPMVANENISWDQEFSALELSTAQSTSAEIEEIHQHQQQEPVASRNQFDADDIAKTAGMLLTHVQHEQNPKFQKSQFLNLMKQLRDGEVIVEGNQMVESDGSRTSTSVHVDVKGKGRAIDPVLRPSGVAQAFGPKMGQIMQQPQVNEHTVQEAGGVQEEDPNDQYFRQENAEYAKYWREAEKARFEPKDSAETRAWTHLQEDWDRFEATTTGISPVSRYQFQENNPYLLGESSMTRHHLLHGRGRQAVLESVLELEAAVQRDVTNADVWYELGVRQQENEREHKALQALQRAVELNPSLLSAWLALGISYTNDNDRQGTYDAILAWVNKNGKYASAVQRFNATTPAQGNLPMHEKFSRLIDCLISMARSDLTGEVDADIQIALAVLLNTNEEYGKAQDCFRTALAVRPEDWLLYNRVGATMANSGQPEEALQYYYKALELNPTYIRARFNLGISCINLRRYEEAVQHVLDALLLQDSDATTEAGGSDRKEVISMALWDSLKTSCLHMQRADLATLCDLKDLEGFRKRFYG